LRRCRFRGLGSRHRRGGALWGLALLNHVVADADDFLCRPCFSYSA
jgi:hypothetical protein